MKKAIFSAIAAFGMMQSVSAQVIDTVITGAGYANNIWYSLENDNQASQPANNWDIALAVSTNPGGLASAALFNYKSGTLYAVPGSTPANFATLDTTGMAASGALYNSDTTWTKGAFNNTLSLGTFDYGWGTYDMASHSGINANRVFVIKYTNGSYKKLTIDLNFTTGYTLKYANLDNSGLQTQTIPLTPYNTKNFIYFSLTNNEVVDREPATANWDFTFLQYHANLGPMGMYPVAGILHNHGVEVAQVHPVANTATMVDWADQTYSSQINIVGYDWKSSGPSGVTIADSTVYFVKTNAGDLWKVIMTGFISGTGGGTGEYVFSKQKLETASVNDLEPNVVLAVYPNPANESVTLVLDNKSASKVEMYNMLGALVYSNEVSANGLQTVNVPVSEFNNGIYQIICTSNGKTANQKLFIQH